MVKNILLLICFLSFAHAEAHSYTRNHPHIHVGNDFRGISFTASELIAFAKNLIGTRYKFGASDPKTGFDCSGFVNYVFKNFGIDVPRQSAAFRNKGKTITLNEALPGDIILFTGTKPGNRTIGHVGIVSSGEGQSLHFIHASSGNVKKVIETPLNNRYKNRFVKVIRLL